MKKLFEVVFRFIQKEWFLLVMVAVIALIFFLNELIGS